MAGAGTQDGRDELAGVTVEDEQGMVHVLPVETVVGDAFLLTVGRIVGAVQIEDDALRDAVALPFLQVELDQRDRQAVAGLEVDGVLQARERRLAGEVAVSRQATTDQLQEWVGAQRRGVVLILIATGDLHDPLADQRLQRVAAGAVTPLRKVYRQQCAETECTISFGKPAETTIGGELGVIEGDVEAGGGQPEGNRLRHGTSPGEAWLTLQPTPLLRCPVTSS